MLNVVRGGRGAARCRRLVSLVVASATLCAVGGIAVADEARDRERLATEDERVREQAPRLDEDRTIQRLVGEERRRLGREERAARGERGRERAARSRGEHRGASRAQARALAEEEFPEFVSAPVWEPLALRAGERVSGYLDDNVVRVDGGPGAA